MPPLFTVCLIRGHAWGEWRMYPRLIGARVEWLRWESRCQRGQCRTARRRWFKVEIRSDRRLPEGIGKAIPVERYLQRIGAIAPRPEALVDGPMPAEVLESLG
jgi:hypothetical protein